MTRLEEHDDDDNVIGQESMQFLAPTNNDRFSGGGVANRPSGPPADLDNPGDEAEVPLIPFFSPDTALRRQQIKQSTEKIVYPSSLDFERVVNQYSIQATRDRILSAISSSADDPIYHRDSISYNGKSNIRRDSLGPPSILEVAGYSTFDPDVSDFPPPPPPPSDLPPPPPPPLDLHQNGFHRYGDTNNRYDPVNPASLPSQRDSILAKLRPKRKPIGYTGKTATRWFLTILIGILTGSISIFIVSCTSTIEKWRSDRMDQLWRNNHRSFTIFSVYAGTNLALALLSCLLCLYQNQAIGSGIPEVKAYLNGVRVRRFTSLSLFLVKIFGTILSVSSGLVIGPEGPLVHIGSILGASSSKLYVLLLGIVPSWCVGVNNKVWTALLKDLSHFAQDTEKRDLVSIGAAAGFAAAFGAPIGGLLFSLEEASSFFEQSMFLKTLVATSIATFLLAVHHGNLSDYSVISLGNFHTSDTNIFLNRVEEIPLYILVAAVGGLLGGIFCQCWKVVQLSRRRLFTEPKARQWWNLTQVVFVSLLTSTLMYYIPLMEWTCRRIDVNDDLVEDKSIFDPWKFHPHQFDCHVGYINELATIFFGSREEAIASILTDPLQFKPQTLVCVGCMFFVLMALTLGIALPSGIFMPTFLIGSSLGGAAGIYFQHLLGHELAPSTFALLGAAALLTGIQRSTVSLCVILVEGTGQVKILIPVIITVVVARYVADRIAPHGLYEMAMEISHYPYLEHREHKKLDVLKVRDIMSIPPITVGPRERAHTIVKLLRESEHSGFPVVDPYTQKFLGLVRRDQLVALLEFGIFDEGEPPSPYDGDDSSTNLSSAPGSPDWTPKPGVGKSPLMHLAYHITDDKYDHISEKNLLLGVSNQSLAQDDYDSNAWLVKVQRIRRGGSTGVLDESMPPIVEGDEDTDGESYGRKDVAIVGINDKDNVYVKWLPPEHKRKYVHIAAVMNRGTYCVNDFTPVSKARKLFTALGLRHMIVLGGESGGQVVGVLTRINFLNEYIKERTGYNFGH